MNCRLLWRGENRTIRRNVPGATTTYQDSSLGHTGGERALSPLRHPCFLSFLRVTKLNRLSHDKPKAKAVCVGGYLPYAFSLLQLTLANSLQVVKIRSYCSVLYRTLPSFTSRCVTIFNRFHPSDRVTLKRLDLMNLIQSLCKLTTRSTTF